MKLILLDAVAPPIHRKLWPHLNIIRLSEINCNPLRKDFKVIPENTPEEEEFLQGLSEHPFVAATAPPDHDSLLSDFLAYLPNLTFSFSLCID